MYQKKEEVFRYTMLGKEGSEGSSPLEILQELLCANGRDCMYVPSGGLLVLESTPNELGELEGEQILSTLHFPYR
jgi:hypothetical protein